MSQESENKKSNMISLNTLNKVSKSICKIICQKGNNKWTGTGFFMSIKYENQVLIKCLLTNYHIIDPFQCYTEIYLQIGDNKTPFYKRKNRISKYFNKPIDITMIEILDDDEFIKDVDFLSYDLNYIKYGYDYYLNKEIFILQHPYGEEMHSSIGKIIDIKEFQFKHDAGTCSGSSGSAVILIENNCVIGIHKGIIEKSGKKIGTFIGELFEGIINDSKLQKRIENIKNNINIETNEIENEETQNNTNNSQNLSQKNDNDKNFDKNNLKNEYKNILTLKYIIQKNRDNVILFSKQFLKKNRRRFVMIINNEREEICHILDISKIKIIDNILEVKLKKMDDEVTTLENMFEETDLMFISGFSSFDSNKLTNISFMFHNCKNLSSIIDIDFLDTSNVTKMDYMFKNCSSIEVLPDISKWDTSKVTQINHMFEGCEKIKSLPDISKWNTSKVTDMKHLFSKCKSLISLPDISKWDISKVKDISHLFSFCESLLSIPDIQKWDLKNIKSMNSLFFGCKSLKSIPDIFKWNIIKVKNMDNIFNGCENLTVLPDISKWKNNNTEKKIAKDCKSIKINPDNDFNKKKHDNKKKKFKNKEYNSED